jgi:hypothetical protein
MDEFRLITLDPGHFHAALVQKEMYAGVSKRVAVYAPLGSDLTEHLNRIARFNQRRESPTCWELDIHAAPDYLQRLVKERPGNLVVLSGRNGAKIGLIRASLEAGLNVLADKPWIIRSADLPSLETALAAAERRGLLAYDIMTERYEITSILQRELVNAPEVFGEKYDYFGLGDFVQLFGDWHQGHKVFCSALITDAARGSGIFIHPLPIHAHGVSPLMLQQMTLCRDDAQIITRDDPIFKAHVSAISEKTGN